MNKRPIPPALYQSMVVEVRGLCSLCHILPVQELHHIKPVAQGGKNEHPNLIPLCGHCHNRVHRHRIDVVELAEAKSNWLKKNEEIITSILNSGNSQTQKLEEIVSGYSALKEVSEFERFHNRLKILLSDQTLFKGDARIKNHTIKKSVNSSSDCWTFENMRFSPLQKTKCRIIHVRGDGPTKIENVKFNSTCSINKSSTTPCNVTINRDDPSFKSFQINFEKEITPNDWAELDFSYYWENTWDLNSDFYSYDIFSWTEELVYDFELAENRRLTKVEGFLIDIFGREWPGLGEVNWSGNVFRWIIKRPPLFCTAVVKYKSIQGSS